ncbi:hypothetical protein BU17DRAFT_58993 [Hysterangium stoloniferum]|nr:hypothetical protein BU17DRAFT_58993 [Hysterangium stoloniferum]
MFVKYFAIALALAFAFPRVLPRELIYERSGRAIYPRRFSQEACGGIANQIGAACNGAVCGVLGGRVPGTLLVAADPCEQQDLADDIINASKQQDAATAATMVALAVKFRQCEKNTPPDFSKNPPALRNSVFCRKAPANAQLNGLVQAQDPANDPSLFFDVATQSTVLKGFQANTFPLGQGGEVIAPPPVASSSPPVVCPLPTNTHTPQPITSANPIPVTAAFSFGSCTNPTVEFGPKFEGRKLRENSFKPVNKAEFNQGSALNGQIVFNAVCNILNDKCKAPTETVTACKNAIGTVANISGGAQADQFNAALGIITDFATIPATPGGGPGSAALASAANFNTCVVPKIAFGIFDGRTENSFAPVGNDYQHGSALNPDIITRFVCDQLVNKCDANTVAINDCAKAITATSGLAGQDFVDAFNSAVSANA